MTMRRRGNDDEAVGMTVRGGNDNKGRDNKGTNDNWMRYGEFGGNKETQFSNEQ